MSGQKKSTTMRQRGVTLKSCQFITDLVAWKPLPSAWILQLAQISYHNATRWHNLMWRLAEVILVSTGFVMRRMSWWNNPSSLARHIFHMLEDVLPLMYTTRVVCPMVIIRDLATYTCMDMYNTDVCSNIPMQEVYCYTHRRNIHR